MDAFVGEIRLLPYGFVPSNWMACQGQTLPINAYAALFSIIGNTYGGNGTTNFNLPDLGSFAAVGAGSGTGLSTYSLGEVAGIDEVKLTTLQLPMHNHALQTGNVTPGPTNSSNTPSSSVLLSRGLNVSPLLPTALYALPPGNTTLAAGTIGNPVGASGMAHDNHQPYLALQYCICISGVFPTRG